MNYHIHNPSKRHVTLQQSLEKKTIFGILIPWYSKDMRDTYTAALYPFLQKHMTTETLPIRLYETPDGVIKIDVKIQDDTIWLNQKQMSSLFWVNVPAISKHVENIITEWELSWDITISKMETVQIEWKRSIKRSIEVYNLDMIISVWYRVNSTKATHFRVWATSILKEYVVKGYAVNQHRLSHTWLQALEKTMQFLKQTLPEMELSGEDAQAITDIIIQYTSTWATLHQFDVGELEIKGTKTPKDVHVTADIMWQELERLKKELISNWTASDLFATEKYTGTLTWIIGNIYQTYDSKPLYPSIESKAAHLLYFVIKDHPFNDGNKRSGAFLFILFLKLYNMLHDATGDIKINDRGLTALTLLIAQSDPKHKDLLIQLVTYLIQ
jgi:prophage maintenance system killer protein